MMWKFYANAARTVICGPGKKKQFIGISTVKKIQIDNVEAKFLQNTYFKSNFCVAGLLL